MDREDKEIDSFKPFLHFKQDSDNKNSLYEQDLVKWISTKNFQYAADMTVKEINEYLETILFMENKFKKEGNPPLHQNKQQDITKNSSIEEREEKLTKWILSREYLFNNIDDKELDKVLKAIDILMRR